MCRITTTIPTCGCPVSKQTSSTMPCSRNGAYAPGIHTYHCPDKLSGRRCFTRNETERSHAVCDNCEQRLKFFLIQGNGSTNRGAFGVNSQQDLSYITPAFGNTPAGGERIHFRGASQQGQSNMSPSFHARPGGQPLQFGNNANMTSSSNFGAISANDYGNTAFPRGGGLRQPIQHQHQQPVFQQPNQFAGINMQQQQQQQRGFNAGQGGYVDDQSMQNRAMFDYYSQPFR